MPAPLPKPPLTTWSAAKPRLSSSVMVTPSRSRRVFWYSSKVSRRSAYGPAESITPSGPGIGAGGTVPVPGPTATGWPGLPPPPGLVFGLPPPGAPGDPSDGEPPAAPPSPT